VDPTTNDKILAHELNKAWNQRPTRNKMIVIDNDGDSDYEEDDRKPAARPNAAVVRPADRVDRMLTETDNDNTIPTRLSDVVQTENDERLDTEGDAVDEEEYIATDTGGKLYRFCDPDFKFTESERVATETKVLDNVAKFGHFEEHKQAAANIGSHKLSIEMGLDSLADRLSQVQEIVGKGAIKVYRNLPVLNRRPICYAKKAKEGEVVYIAYLNKLQRYKFGMSAWLYERMKKLHEDFGLSYAALVLPVPEIEALLGSEIDTIMALKLPGIRPSERNLVALQLVEAVLACAFKSCTRTIAERLVQVPNQLVLDVFCITLLSCP